MAEITQGGIDKSLWEVHNTDGAEAGEGFWNKLLACLSPCSGLLATANDTGVVGKDDLMTRTNKGMLEQMVRDSEDSKTAFSKLVRHVSEDIAPSVTREPRIPNMGVGRE